MAAGISINENCLEYIKKILPIGSTILELGSGEGTTWLSELGYVMYSVENQSEWFDKYPNHTTYINCRTKYYDNEYTAPNIENQKGWYHPDDIFPNLPESYDLILVDGPGGHLYGRGGFYKHIDEFNADVPIIFDDLQIDPNIFLMKKVAKKLKREYIFLEDDCTGVILGKS